MKIADPMAVQAPTETMQITATSLVTVTRKDHQMQRMKLSKVVTTLLSIK